MTDVEVLSKSTTPPDQSLPKPLFSQDRPVSNLEVNKPAIDPHQQPEHKPFTNEVQNLTEPPVQDGRVSPLGDASSPPIGPSHTLSASSNADGPFSDLEVNTQVSALSPPIPESGRGPSSQVPDEAAQLEVPIDGGLEVEAQHTTNIQALESPPKTERTQKPEETVTVQKVTPLHMLHKKPGYIDCPFCRKRSITSVSKIGTSMQTLAGVVLCLLCVCLTCLPCWAGWFENIEHRCANCGNLVLRRLHDGPMETFGPETHPQSVPSRYPAAESTSQGGTQG